MKEDLSGGHLTRWKASAAPLLLALAVLPVLPGCSGEADAPADAASQVAAEPAAVKPAGTPPPVEVSKPSLPGGGASTASTTAPTSDATTGPAGKVAAPATSASASVDCPPGAAAAEACKVSKELYLGWRSFHTHCFQCHGGSAMGSTFAPNLMERLATRVDHARFLEVLQKGYVGQMGAMPSFAKNTAVQKDQEAIYAYLVARRDGLLPPGRPQRMP